MHINRQTHTLSTLVQSAHKRNGKNQAQEPGWEEWEKDVLERQRKTLHTRKKNSSKRKKNQESKKGIRAHRVSSKGARLSVRATSIKAFVGSACSCAQTRYGTLAAVSMLISVWKVQDWLKRGVLCGAGVFPRVATAHGRVSWSVKMSRLSHARFFVVKHRHQPYQMPPQVALSQSVAQPSDCFINIVRDLRSRPRRKWFLGFGLLCRHTASTPITTGLASVCVDLYSKSRGSAQWNFLRDMALCSDSAHIHTRTQIYKSPEVF